MGHLYDLPNELPHPILQELQGGIPGQEPPQTTALYQLCLASKTLARHAQPILYAAFWVDKERATWRIRAFLRTVIANPSLAAHVNYLKLSTWRAWDRESDEWDDSSYLMRDHACYDDHRQYSPAQNRRDRKYFQKAIRDLALVEKKVWRHAVRKDVDEVFVAMLLLLLPNLRELDIMASSNAVFLAKALCHAPTAMLAAKSVPSLQSLERVFYGVRGNTSCGNINDVAPFFRLPKIHTIKTGYRMGFPLPRPHFYGDINLEHLQLQINGVHPESLNELGVPFMNVVPRLKDLHIYFPVPRIPVSVLVSLRALTSLQRLRTNLPLLLNDPGTNSLVDVLPTPLEELHVEGFNYDDLKCRGLCAHGTNLYSQLQKLVDAKASSLPFLRKIGVWDLPCTHRIPAPDELLDACRGAEVTLDDIT